MEKAQSCKTAACAMSRDLFPSFISLGQWNLLTLYFLSSFNFFMTFLQVTRPDGKPETLGLVVLDEPMAKQSDPTGTLYTLSWTRI